MAELWFRRGTNPDEPDEYALTIVVDPDGAPADRAAEYQRSPRLAAVLHAPPSTTSEQMSAKISDGEVWPLILAPPPGR